MAEMNATARELNRQLAIVRRQQATDEGKCIWCFKEPREPDRVLCEKCAKKRRKA